jgi:uncharacterized protein
MLSWLMLIAAFAVALNAGYACLQIRLLQRHPGWPKWLAAAIGLWAFTMAALLVLEIFAPHGWQPFLHHWLYLPLAVEMIWNVLFLQFLVQGLIIATLILGRLQPRAAPPAPATPEGLSRRHFLYLLSYGAVPATAIGMGVHGTLTSHDLTVRDFSVPIVGLPPELEGFTIAHVSDLHSGLFCGPTRLRIIRDYTNDLNADLLTITGDVINKGMSEFPAALAVIRKMRSRYGLYLCEGNHDLIPGPGVMARACAENHLPWLYNSTAIVPVEGRRLVLGGLPWMKHGFENRPELVTRLFPERQEGDVRILLTHFPQLFDIADSADLVLAGHTHGGQIMLGEVGLGPLFFKYWSGLYQRPGGKTTLVVSNGCGDWFPCRIGAPAEVGVIRLTAAKTV